MGDIYSRVRGLGRSSADSGESGNGDGHCIGDAVQMVLQWPVVTASSW